MISYPRITISQLFMGAMVLSLLIPGYYIATISQGNPIQVELFDDSQTLDIAIIFVNYDMELIDTETLTTLLPSQVSPSPDGKTFQYPVEYTVFDANEVYEQQLIDYVESIAIYDDITSDIDLTALQEQAKDGHQRDIFFDKLGTSISAELMEEWFHANTYEDEADYRYYVLNFSSFDDPVDSYGHWFTVEEIDPDTWIERHWWRNEWDFPLNFDVKFPYPAYSQKYADYFFDPYMFQWFNKFLNIWFGGYREYYMQELGDYVQNGGDLLTYISQWLNDAILQQHWSQSPLGPPVYGNTLSVQLAVFHNVSHLGYTNQDFDWIVNTTHSIEQLLTLMPGSDISFEITYANWDDYPQLNNIFQKHTWNITEDYNSNPPIPDYVYYDGIEIWDDIWDKSMTENLFDFDQAENVVTGYAFIVDNGTFSLPGLWAGGGLYTGMGGGGKMAQLMELDRLFYPDRITPRQGFSRVVLHELGHAVGLNHVASFTGDVMNYYPGVVKFSTIKNEQFQRHAANIKAFKEINSLLQRFVSQPEMFKLQDLVLINRYQDTYYQLRDLKMYDTGYELLEVFEEYLMIIKTLRELRVLGEDHFNEYYQEYQSELVHYISLLN